MVSLAGLLGTFAILGPVGIDQRWMAEFDDEAKKTWVAGDCLVVEHSEIVKVSKQQGKTRTTYYELQIFVDRLAERHGDGDSVVVQNGSLPVRPAYKYPHMSQSGASRRFQTKEEAQSFKASNFVGRERICYWDPSKPRWCVAMNNVGGDWAPVQASIVITVIGWLGPCFLFFCWGCLSVCCEDDREESSHGYDPYNRRGGPRPSYHDRAAAARAEAAALADAVRESDEAAQAIAAVEAATRREEAAAEAARRRAHSEMLKEGARVSFLGTYPGKITAVNFNGTFAILFDDGTKMPSAQAEKIELIAAAPVDSTVSTSSSTPPAQTVEEEVASNSPSQPAPSSSFQLARARSFQRARSVARAPFERARSFARRRDTPEASAEAAAPGENHSDLASSLNNVAMSLQAENKLAEAEPMYRRVLAIQENAFGENHPKVASSRGNLGILLDAKACQLEEDGASDPAALAQIYTEAADMLTFRYGAEDEDVLRCRQRAAELAIDNATAHAPCCNC